MQLSQILFSQGFGSRREVAGLIGAGRVCGPRAAQVLDDPHADLAPEGLVLHVDGRPWPVVPRAVVLLHKPAGYECSMKPRHWPSVMSLLPPPLRQRGVQPVGRLDQGTTGALLLTDDGTLLHRLTSPKWHVPKVYEVRTARPVLPLELQALRDGVLLLDEPAPVKAVAAEQTGPHTLRLVLAEGKYHQVKRMVAATGNHCEALHRSAMGSITLPEDVPAGQWRWMDAGTVAAMVGLPAPAF
jgi:16S rRNA pseudouridine516 synthase